MEIAPCKNCMDRNANCHSVCERYKTWYADLQAEKARIANIKNIDIQLHIFSKTHNVH